MEVPSYQCRACGFSLWHPVAELGSSTLGLYDDARYPGRCILVFRDHIEDFAELGDERTLAFTRDAKRAARAIQAVTGAGRVNYAILGNEQPHLHFHLIPRTAAEPSPMRSPWDRPDAATPLSPEQRQDLVARLASELSRISAVAR